MRTVGIGTLRSDLSAYLERVRKGARIVVTDRGNPVAELVPYGVLPPEDRESQIAALVEEGLVTAPQSFRLARPPRGVRLHGHGATASETIARMREERGF